MDPDLDAAVLRQTFLGDVQLGHDLQAADNGGLKLIDFGRNRLNAQQTVDAKTNAQTLLLGFEMDVAGMLFEGFDEQFVDELDDRGRLGHFGQFAIPFAQAFQQLDFFFVSSLRDQFVDGIAADPELLFDDLDNVLPPSQYRFETQAAQ